MKDNVDDMCAKDRQYMKQGSKNPKSKLKEEDVIAIRAITGKSQRDIARIYGISHRQIQRIQKRIDHIASQQKALPNVDSKKEDENPTVYEAVRKWFKSMLK